MTRPPPIPPLFPYPTLFRSRSLGAVGAADQHRVDLVRGDARLGDPQGVDARRFLAHERSEEHTSELQSHVNLVCRLLLEKKKKNKNNSNDGLQNAPQQCTVH